MATVADNINSFSEFKFTPESGTTDEGHDYEEKVTAFLALKACQNMDNCWISSNMKGMVPLDDVVICTKKSGKNMAYLCQIKHSQKCTPLPGKELDEANSKLSMRKFYDRFNISTKSKPSIKTIIDQCIPVEYRPIDNFTIVIFTNRTILAKDVMFKLKDEQIFNTSIGKVYSLNCENFSNVDTEFSNFLNYVNVYAQQGSASDIKQNIQDCMQDILGIISIPKNSLNNYMKYIQNWIQITQDKIMLDRKYVKALVELSFLLSHALEINSITENIKDNIPGHYLWEDITNKSLFIKKSYLTFVTQMISNKLHHFNMPQTLSQIGIILFSSENYNDQRPTIKQKYILSCFHGSSPFILDIEQFLNLPKFEFIHYIPTGYLDNLKNLNQITDNTFVELLNERITLNCGRNIALREMFKDSLKILLPKLTVSDALSLINGEDNSPYIKDEILFERKFKSTFLKVEALGISNDLFVLNILNFNKHNVIAMLGINEDDICVGNNYEDRFKYVFVNEDEFKIFPNVPSRNVHFLKIINNNSKFIEWVGTSGSVNNIKQFREDISTSVTFEETEDNLINLKDIHNYFQQPFVIISGVPGIGKSTAIKQIGLSTPLNIWVLRVNLLEEQNYFETLTNDSNIFRDSITCLRHFYKNQNSFLRELYNIKLQNKEVLILFDGFDEIAPTFTKPVTEIITRIRKEGFKIILTTRMVLERHIENTFGTFSISLCAFNRAEQEDYLKAYFVLNNCEDVLTRVDVTQLLDQIDMQNSVQFCSIPLHIYLVADALLKDDNNLSGNINLLKIYEQYVDKKIDIYKKKIEQFNVPKEHFNNYHKYYAIKTVLRYTKHYNILKKDIDSRLKIFDDLLKKGGEKIGLLISPVDQIFIHRTIAEYYVANWLADVIKNDNRLSDENRLRLEFLKSEIFNEEFDSLRLFFNFVINKNCKLHEEIIKKNFKNVNEMIQSNIKVNELNKYKQTLLHALISSCNIHEKSYKLNTDLGQILYLLFKNHSNILQTRDFCKITARGYAKMRVYNSSLKIKLMPIQIDGKDIIYYVSYNKPFNMIEFLFAQLDANINIKDILSILPKAKEISFESLVTLTKKGYFAGVIDLLKTPEGINAVDENNNNILHWAIEHNKTSIISQLLLQYYCFLNLFSARNNNGDTPILIAVQFGNLNIIKKLVNKLPTLTPEDQDLALIYAVIGDFTEVIHYLLSNSLKKSHYMHQNPLPIYIAYSQGKYSTLKYLLRKYVEPEPKVTFIHYASTYTNQYIIKSVIELWKNHLVPKLPSNIPKQYIEWLQQTTDLNTQDNSGLTPLMYAVKKDNKNVTDYLISIGADLYGSDKDGFTCLHHAVQSGSLETLKILCLKMNDINLKTISGLTPLHLSVENGNFKILQVLLNNNADLKCIDNLGRTCLHYAIANGNENITKLLIHHDADVNAKDFEGTTCLHTAIKNRNLLMVRLIIANNGNPKVVDNKGLTCLHYAVKEGVVNVVKYFAQFYKDLNVKNNDGETPLQYAALFGKLEAIKFLIRKNADPNCLDSEGNTCLHSSSISGDTKTIKYFMQYDNVNAKNYLGRTPLHCTAYFGKLDASKFLLSKRADVKCLDNEGGTCLHSASRGGHTNSIGYFLQYHDVNVKNYLSWTPLHLTAKFGKLEASNFLVSKGANLNCLDNDGGTYLHCASIGGHTNSIEYFLQYHDVNVKNYLGCTPLHVTAEFGNLEASKLLVSNEADVNCLDNYGGTCLHSASIGGHIKSIEYFLQYDDINVKKSLSWTPLHLTAEFGKLEASNFLVSKGADVKCLDNYGDTCLHSACIGGHTNSIEYFLKYDDVNVKNALGRTPLHLTAEFGKLEASKLLVNKGADIKFLDNEGGTCLHRASKGGHINSIEYFLQYDDINMKDSLGWTPLHYSAYFGKLEVSKSLVSKGADVKCLDKEGCTCLHWASIGGHTNSIEYFLQYNKVHVKDSLGRTPLHLTAEFGKLETSKFLVNEGADVLCLDKERGTCLHSASRGGHTNSIEYFLQYDDINLKNSLGRTPLHLTAETGNLKACKFLVKKGADVKCLDTEGASCLHLASIGGHTNSIEYFLQYHDVNVKNYLGCTPLHVTAEFGTLEASKLLVSKEADVKCLDNYGGTCLHSASIGGHINSIEYFLQYDDINVKKSLSWTPLHLTAEFGKLEASKFLVSAGANVKCLDNYGGTCLHSASIGGHINSIEYFLKYDDVNVENSLGRTPLHLTAEFGKLEASKFLVSAGANVKCLHNEGGTCLHSAAKGGYTNSIEYFLQYDDVNVKDSLGWTPLHYTAYFGKLDASKFLVSKGADVKCLDNEGGTCLHWSSIGEHINSIEYFLQYDDINVKNSLGRTPLHLIAEFGKLETSKFLVNEGADVKCLDKEGGTCLHSASRGGHTNSIEYFLQYDDVNVKDSLGRTPLHYSAEFEKLEATKFLLSKGADVEYLDNDVRKRLQHLSKYT